jgi:hypothetical protein
MVSSVVLVVLFSLHSLPVFQGDTAACAALVQKAFDSLKTNCSSADGNTACFGFGGVTASLANSADQSKFSQPGNTVSLADLKSLQTSPFDASKGQWGVALMNVPGSVPLAVSDKGLRFILLGDVQIDNMVPQDQVFQPAHPITVKPLVGANLRVSPSPDGKVIANAPGGTALQADGLSTDGAWVRVINQGSPVWISRQVVAASGGNLTDLPVIKSSSRTMMQAIHLKTSTAASDCASAPPSMLLVQGPENVPATITVNGADIRISSTIALRLLPDNQMQLFVLSGGAQVGGVTVPAGFTIAIQLNADGTDLDGSWTGLRPITEDERQFLTTLETIPPDGLLHYGIQIPSAGDVAALQAQVAASGKQGSASGSAVSGVDCQRFRPTSPLGGVARGDNNFYWDPAPGATSYQVNLYRDTGALVNSFQVPGYTTTVAINAVGVPGNTVTWEVQAFLNGQLACTTAPVTMPLVAAPQAVNNNNNNNGGQVAPPPKCSWC